MYNTTRTIFWWVLIIGGCLNSMRLFIISNDRAAFVSFAISIALWIGWFIFSKWFFGLRRRVAAHMGTPISRLTFVSKDVGSSRLTDYIRSLEHLSEPQGPEHRVGIATFTILERLQTAEIPLQPLEWKTIEAADGELINVPKNPAYLLEWEGRRFIASIFEGDTSGFQQEEGWESGAFNSFHLCAASLQDANDITRWLNTEASKHSIYRGKMLLVASPAGASGPTTRIQSPPTQDRSKIVLPDSIIGALERLVLGHSQHHERLAKHGHTANLGLLLHGPPGVGKTLVTRHLIACCPDRTVIVPTDMAVETLRESFRLANYLEPALLVLEDVDLLAKDRNSSQSVDGLQELMNQMDGLTPSSNVTVIMSTNRPKVLEPALASRPGRISQAIEFPLPDASDREQLLRLFLKETSLTDDVSLEKWAQRIDGASPAFIRELCRRAILFGAERADVGVESSGKELGVSVSQEDLDQAIHELVFMGGKLTSQSLGFPSATRK